MKQFADLRASQGRDPAHAGQRLQLLPDAGFREHPPIGDHHHRAEPEALAELLDLAGHCGGVRSVACEDLHRDGAALTVAQQTEDDLQRAPFAVSGIPPLGQRATSPFEVGRGDVVDHEATVLQALTRQLVFNLLLSSEQPVQGSVQIIGRRGFHLQELAQAAGQGLGIPSACGGQLGAGLQDPRHDQGHHQAALQAVASGQ